MPRKRTVWQQLKSGLRIAGAIVLGFVFFLALWASVAVLTMHNNFAMRGVHPVLGGFGLLVLSTGLFLTTRYWAKWLLAILAFCTCRLLIGVPAVLVLGHMEREDLSTALVMIPALLISTLLALRFLRKPPMGAERIGVVALNFRPGHHGAWGFCCSPRRMSCTS